MGIKSKRVHFIFDDSSVTALAELRRRESPAITRVLNFQGGPMTPPTHEEVMHRLAERLPLKVSPMAGKTSSYTMYQCGGIYLSTISAEMFTCPTSTTVAAGKKPDGWHFNARAGWLCPRCSPDGIVRTSFPHDAADLLKELEAGK